MSSALLHLGLAAVRGQADVPLVGASGACYAMLLHAAEVLRMSAEDGDFVAAMTRTATKPR